MEPPIHETSTWDLKQPCFPMLKKINSSEMAHTYSIEIPRCEPTTNTRASLIAPTLCKVSYESRK